jgi:crossover junction endodeoxyribonuclease RuvC
MTASPNLVVLGIDPGSRFTGFGLVTRERASTRLVAAGRIAARAKDPLPDRLLIVYRGLMEIIGEYQPTVAAVEDVFFAKNVRSAIRLGHARGVALLAAAQAGLSVFEYPPATVKTAVVGYGRATKDQVGLMVRQMLGIYQPLAEDAADALAVALCHLNLAARANAAAPPRGAGPRG